MPRTGNRRIKGSPGPVSQKEERESVTRCLCGKKHTNGLMIQCENCKVWQHCVCVDIPDFDSCPTEYYCEQCNNEEKEDSQTGTKSRSMKALSPRKETKPLTKPKAPENKSPELPTKLETKFEDPRSKLKAQAMAKSYSATEPIRIKLNVTKSESAVHSLVTSPKITEDPKLMEIEANEEQVDENEIKDTNEESSKKFTTKRGRKTTKVTYSHLSDEEAEKLALGVEKDGKLNHIHTVKPTKKSKPKYDLVDEVSKRKFKETKPKASRSDMSMPKLNLFISSPAPESLMTSHLLLKHPDPNNLPHQNSFLLSSPIQSPTIPPSNSALPTIFLRASSPPPKPRNTNSKVSMKEMIKRVVTMKKFVEKHQANLKTYLHENGEEEGESYKAKKQRYSKSTKMVKEFGKDCNEFLDSFSVIPNQ